MLLTMGRRFVAVHYENDHHIQFNLFYKRTKNVRKRHVKLNQDNWEVKRSLFFLNGELTLCFVVTAETIRNVVFIILMK